MKHFLIARFGLGSSIFSDRGNVQAASSFLAELSTSRATLVTSPLAETAGALSAFFSSRVAMRDVRALIDAHRKRTGQTLSMQAAMAVVEVPDTSRQDVFYAQVANRFSTAWQADIGFRDRLVWFWGNHFAVSGASGGLESLAPGPLEVEAIRPHVAGSFADMLLAASMHWSMLRYLDGVRSLGPLSREGTNRDRGLNENWAREILELHTIGVEGGYSQDDVVALAEMLTGWRYHPLQSEISGRFLFQEHRHEPGAKTLLGKVYPDDGLEQGVAALRDLARHPATARHLATKLARHFIADEPPERLVRELTAVFLETNGDLAAISQALVDSPEAQEAPPTKLRLPQEFLVAMLRATGLELEPALIDRMCRVMGQPVWQPPGPDGFPDTVDYWLSPEGMKRRLDVAMAVAERVDPTLEPMDVLEVTIGDIATDDTQLSVSRAESRQQAFALLFMSPEFQWR